MITVHHLENSRSQRILWLLEELGAEYRVKRYDRDKKTNLAPPALKKIHPLGKSPVIDDNGAVIAETGAIIEYLVEKFDGALSPARSDSSYLDYKYWMHAAEGSYAPIMVMTLLMTRMKEAPMPFFAKPIAKKLVGGLEDAYLGHTRKALYDNAETTLARSAWLTGDNFTAADIIMSFPFEAFAVRGDISAHPQITRFLEAIADRPAYKAALSAGGPYAFAR